MREHSPTVSDVVREVERRILNHFMDLLILVSLDGYKGQVSGYDVIKYLHRKYNFLPSPGTVYSCLYDMERRGLLKGYMDGRRRVYSLTRQGAETVRAILDGRDRILNFTAMILQKNSSKAALQPSTLFPLSELHAEP
ncbi:MAG: PadR family transcriptional regulator [Candidatus Bathyarchaeia archaeon]